jgi:hypothetical protein
VVSGRHSAGLAFLLRRPPHAPRAGGDPSGLERVVRRCHRWIARDGTQLGVDGVDSQPAAGRAVAAQDFQGIVPNLRICGRGPRARPGRPPRACWNHYCLRSSVVALRKQESPSAYRTDREIDRSRVLQLARRPRDRLLTRTTLPKSLSGRHRLTRCIRVRRRNMHGVHVSWEVPIIAAFVPCFGSPAGRRHNGSGRAPGSTRPSPSTT